MPESDAARLDSIVSPFGVVSRCSRLTPAYEPLVRVHTADVDDMGPTLTDRAHPPYELRYSGAGRSLTTDTEARTIAIAEALERYASNVVGPEDFIAASASELGLAAVPIELLPRCSARELADPACPLTLLHPDASIRWVRGIDLIDGGEVFVPGVMAFMGMVPWPSERFWLQISTGCSAHRDMCKAVVQAIFEVIERDAVSLTWLQRLNLPRVPNEALEESAVKVVERAARRGARTLVYDATTDLKVPTVYCLQLAPRDTRAAHLVGCATSTSIARAATKAIMETTVSRLAVHAAERPPAQVRDFYRVMDGAAFLGQVTNSHAFDFLINEETPHRLSAAESIKSDEDRGVLKRLLRTLAVRGFHAYAVDLTTRETLAAGLVVVRVIIPELQPISFRPPAQYRGHPRLYEAPVAMGFPVSAEEELNPWPQPFP